MPSAPPIIDKALVRRLVTQQFPQWADLGIRAVTPGGWDNRTYRLGESMLVRLPSAARYVAQVEKEQRWLPWLASLLPLAIPEPLAKGRPTADYPWPWSIYRWLEGDVVTADAALTLDDMAVSLAGFLTALHAVDAGEGPLAGPHSFFRGGKFTYYETEAHRALALLDRKIDVELAEVVLADAVSSRWEQPAVWVHGDLSANNLLHQDGELSAVIDFGCLAVGDPACDLVIAWTLFSGRSREAFQSGVALDADTWRRARGWALWKALITVAGPSGDQREVQSQWRVIDEVLAEVR